MSVGVVGAGTMGAGIACVAAFAGYHVTLVDRDHAVLEKARERVQREAERAGASAAMERIVFETDLRRMEGAGIALEAVPEDAAIKQRLFSELAVALPRDAILATNTSSLSVTALAAASGAPERLIGLHFFNPPLKMPLVEAVRTELTDPAFFERALEFVRTLGKRPVAARDTPGFIVNRIARPYYLQSMHALERGVAAVPALDALARGIGMPMGPFELMDLIGLDVNFATSETVFERTKAERLRPLEMQREMIAEGRLGRKAGRGFYDYGAGARATESPHEPTPRLEPSAAVIAGDVPLADEFETLLRAAGGEVERWSPASPERDLRRVRVALDLTPARGPEKFESLAKLARAIPQRALILSDAYVEDIERLRAYVPQPERVVGFGIVGPLAMQRVVEIVNDRRSSIPAFATAIDFFETVGKRTQIVKDGPGLFLGRTFASIFNEATHALAEEVATEEDIDVAMRLGTHYPLGPLSWARRVGVERLVAMLNHLAECEGPQYAPAASLSRLAEPALT